MNDKPFIPFFSVIIPTYNRAHMLPKAIESVLGQTFADWELIVVDDGSTDNTNELVTAYTDPRIIYVYQQNAERSAARNNGIEKSKGRYICFLDSDDYFLENRLELLFGYLTTPGAPCLFAFTGLRFTNCIELTYAEPDGNIFDYLITNVIGVPQVCISAALLKQSGFNKNFYVAEDLELWLRLAKNCKPEFVPSQCTVIATQHDDRTVNERKNNSGMAQLRVLKYIFADEFFRKAVTHSVRQVRFSNTYFSIARHYMYNNRKLKAMSYLIKSLAAKTFHPQTRHKLFIFANLFTGRLPEQYR